MTAQPVSLVGNEFHMTAKVWGHPFAHAIRGQFGWHIPLPRRRVGARYIEHWTSVKTRQQAAAVLTVLAQKAL